MKDLCSTIVEKFWSIENVQIVFRENQRQRQRNNVRAKSLSVLVSMVFLVS